MHSNVWRGSVGFPRATLLWAILEQAIDKKPHLSKEKRSENILDEVNHCNITKLGNFPDSSLVVSLWGQAVVKNSTWPPRGLLEGHDEFSSITEALLVLPCTLSCFPSCQGICTRACPNDTTWERAIFAHECVCRRVLISVICKCAAMKAPKYKTCIFNYSWYIIKAFQICDFFKMMSLKAYFHFHFVYRVGRPNEKKKG